MNQEVEVQVIIKNPQEAEKRIKKFATYVGVRRQVDKYFVLPRKNYFAKNPPKEYLRIRFEKDKNHLNYSFLHFDKKGWLRTTDEYETLIDKPGVAEEIFKKIGLIPKVTVIKNRRYFHCRNFEVTLDTVERLGHFMEIEAKKDFGGIEKTRKACMDFLKKLTIKYEINKDMGYPRMLYKKLNKI